MSKTNAREFSNAIFSKCVFCQIEQYVMCATISYSNIAWAASDNTHNLTHCPWNDNNPSKLDNLFKLQKRAIRTCTNSEYTSHTKELFKKLNTLNMFDINKVQSGIFMHRYLYYTIIFPNHLIIISLNIKISITTTLEMLTN